MRAIFLLPALSLVLSAQEPILLEAPIQRVRLHPDEAWVTRSGRLRLTSSGTHRIQVAGLPPGLKVEDLQASARGPEGLRLGDLSVTSDVRVVTETPEWKKLEAERDALREKRDAIEAQGEAAKQELEFLKNLQAAHEKEISSRMTYATPSATAILELGRSLQTRAAELLAGERKRKRDLEKLSREEARVNAEIQRRSSERRTAPSRVTLEITSTQESPVEIELGYRTRAARWRPLYEARLSEDRKKLDLALYAAITQNSSENWSGVRLEISNARPSRDLSVPVYSGGVIVNWEKYLPPQPAPAVPYDAKRDLASANQIMYRADMPKPVAEPQPVEAEATESSATVIEEATGLAATFLVEGRKDVPSDNEPHRFKVLAQNVNPQLSVFTTPRLETTAFLLARFVPPGGMPLFPGSPVVRFAGNQRLGEASLVIPSAGQAFSLGFGPYKSVRVAFQKVDRKLEQVGFSKDRLWNITERAELDNDGGETLDVEVQDRILKSGNEQVKIALLPGFAPDWKEALPGVRAWKFKLSPKEHKALEMPLSIRVPKEGVVSGLGDLGLPTE
jgi:uncharacterized protein (TIGR02231 family)